MIKKKFSKKNTKTRVAPLKKRAIKKNKTQLAVDIGFAVLASPEASNFVGLLLKSFGQALCEHAKGLSKDPLKQDPLKLVKIGDIGVGNDKESSFDSIGKSGTRTENT